MQDKDNIYVKDINGSIAFFQFSNSSKELVKDAEECRNKYFMYS